MDLEIRDLLNRALGELLNHWCHACDDACNCSVGEAKSLLRLALARKPEPTAAEERAAVVAFLRDGPWWTGIKSMADAIERGEHRG